MAGKINRIGAGVPVVILGALVGDGAPSSLTDHCHSLGSLASATGGGRLVPQLRCPAV